MKPSVGSPFPVLLALLALLGTHQPGFGGEDKDAIAWHDVRKLSFEGQGWTDVKEPFDRLPASAEAKVPKAVWGLSRHSAGMAVRFVTDAPAIHARWQLTSAQLAMPHMPATGVSGLDLYVRTKDGWRWVNVGVPKAVDNTVALVSGLPTGEREYLLYLPLYNGVKSVEVGVAKGRNLAKAPARAAGQEKPIVFYGTSITHGACASRPGMCHPAILGRRLDRPVINLGFSGNGRMDAEVVNYLAELDPAIYVIDCLPNMGAADVSAKVGPLVTTLRKSHPNTPILLVEDRSYANSHLLDGPKKRNDTSRAALRAEYDRMVKSGVKGLGYLEGDKLLGPDRDDTVDSSHPNDLGFQRHADAFQPVLEGMLKGRK